MTTPFMGPVPTGDWSVASKVQGSIWGMFAVTTLFLSLRVYCRVFRTKTLWWDDYLLCAGWGFLLVSTSLISHIFRLGYTTTTLGVGSMIPMNLAADDMHKLALGLSKTSFALTLLRFTKGWPRYVIIGVMVVMNTVFLTHCVLVWRQSCGLPNAYTFAPCWDPSTGGYMNMIGSVFSAVSDFILAFLPIKVILGLQMERREKLGIAFAISVGVLAGIVAIIKSIESLTIRDIMNPNFAHNLAVLSIWIEAEPNATIVAASIPVLRLLFRDVKNSLSSSQMPGSYLRSDNQSKFHASSHVRSNGTVKGSRITERDDDSSEQIILQGTANYKGGIKQTREVVVDYGMKSDFSDREDQGFELQRQPKQSRLSNV